MENAISLIKKARDGGALIFAPQNLECPELYKAEVTEIKARPDEFHDMKGKFMPNRSVTDRISEAAGIDFIAEKCRVAPEIREEMPEFDLPRRTVFIGYAQGRMRLPDGSWRNSTVSEYEFDPMLRAVKEGKGAKSREALEYSTFARQRASTGARLGVIRQLTGLPVSFTREEVAKPLVFSRIVQNTDFILGTKEGRMMAIAAATGVAGLLYGRQAGQPAPAQEVTDSSGGFGEDPDGEPAMRPADDQHTSPSGSSPADLAAQAASDAELERAADDGFGDLPLAASKPPPEDEKRKGLVATLKNYLNNDKLNDAAANTVRALLANTEEKTETLEQYVALLREGRGLKVKVAS